MELKISKTTTFSEKVSTLLICKSVNDLKGFKLNNDEINFIKTSVRNKNRFISINQYKRWVFIQLLPEEKKGNELYETLRREASKLKACLNKHHIKQLTIGNLGTSERELYAYLEGLVLSHYSFLKYFEKKKEKENKLEVIKIKSKELNQNHIDELLSICESVYFARDLVNEPLSFLTAISTSG